MPLPPTRRMSDVLNPSFVDMVISSFEAGDRDPCNSEYMTDDLDKLCEAIHDNDLTSIMESFDYPVVVCHSPDDELGKRSLNPFYAFLASPHSFFSPGLKQCTIPMSTQ